MVLHAVLHADERFRIFRSNAQNTRDPHPEDRAGAAEQKTRANANDVACADGCRKGRCQRAELGDIALGIGRIILRDRQLNTRSQLTLNENHDGAPHEAVNGVDDIKHAGGA